MELSRRRFMRKSLAASFAAALSGKLLASHQGKNKTSKPESLPDLPSLKDRSVLFVSGGWKGHEPFECRDLLVPWLKKEGATVRVEELLDVYAEKEYMAAVDLVVQVHTMSKISPEQSKGLLEAVSSGVGLAGWHGGLCDSFRQNTEYQFMTGGQWVAHPGGVIDYSVQITDHEDPVTGGLADFNIRSEQYYMHVDPNVKVLATTTFNGDHAPWIDGATMPITWKKMHGKGRIFYTSLGHVASDFDVPEALEMLQRGIKWASASKYSKLEKWLSPVYPGK